MDVLERVALAAYPRKHAIAKMASELRKSSWRSKSDFLDAAKKIARPGTIRSTAKEIEEEVARQQEISAKRGSARQFPHNLGMEKVRSGERLMRKSYKHFLRPMLERRLGTLYAASYKNICIIDGVLVFFSNVGYSPLGPAYMLFIQATGGKFVSVPFLYDASASWRLRAAEIISGLLLTQGLGIRYVDLETRKG